MISAEYILIYALYLSITSIPVRLDKPTRNVEITAEEEKLRDPEGYLAIKAIHAILDDDQSGSIDPFESTDFLAEDLKFGESEIERREKAFHGNDDAITVDDLWETWFQSEERNWDQMQVIAWLVGTVRLPQYASNFLSSRVAGTHLPRMAVQNSTFLANTLGIRSYVHRQKLQLKALDLVLFGSQDSSSLLYVYKFALTGLLIALVTVLIIFKTHKNRARKQMEELSSRLSKLRDMETDFEGVQQKMENGKQSAEEHSSDNVGTNKSLDLEQERRAADIAGFDSLPFSLQNLLRRTYEIESSFLNQQKLDCLHEMREAKELVDKMRRKQTSIVNSLKLATGAAAGTDDIDTKIFNLKTRMEQIKMSLEEERSRWAEIESLCGFSITGPFGIAHGTAFMAQLNPRNIAPSQIIPVQTGFDEFSLAEHKNGVFQQHFDVWSNGQNGPILQPSPSLQQLNSIRPQSSVSAQDESASVASLQTEKRRKGNNKLKQFFRLKSKH